ncbi:MAG: hypothetical protein J6P03_06765 [Opitutales bacterium]|nr:hypothetical protein [Opitutales bacterium]
MAQAWAPFKTLKNSPLFTPRDFAETLDGGQSFRWNKIGESAYEGVFENIAARLALAENGLVKASLPKSINADIAAEKIAEFLDYKRDYQKIIASQTDSKALAAAKNFPTLRILRQTPAEAIICFICSSSKRITQIKQCVALLSQNLGDEICEGFRALPSLQKIADAPDETLKACKLGFRAAYLKKTAQKILSDNFDPNSLIETPYPEAKKYLLTLSGIGEKVADCILLFGAAKFEAFPVDTWISKAMANMYGLKSPSHTRAFAAQKFGKYAGYVQQLIFADIRKKSE